MSKLLFALSLTVAACGSPPELVEDPLTFCSCAARPNETPQCKQVGITWGIWECVYSCNPGWLDCDGNTANGCETRNDTNNCNACGHRCPAGVNEVAACVSTGCIVECASGWGDCNNNPADGCETSLDTTSNCAYCGFACGANETCIIGAGCSGCGDGICHGHETHTNCPEDCPCAVGSDCGCGDGVCRTSCLHVICL